MTSRSKLTLLATALLLVGGAAAVAVTLGMQRGTAIAATVNGEVIYARDLGREVNIMAREYGIDLAAGGSTQRAEITRVVLDQMIEQRLILQEARKYNALPSDAQVIAQLDEIRRSFPTPEEFDRALAARQLTVADLRDRLRNSLAVRNLMNSVTAATVSDAEIDAYFREHRKDFERPEQVRVKHILLDSQQMAEFVLGKLQRGTPFEELARQYSNDPGSREQGGDLGFVSHGQLVPEFEEAAFALKPKAVSNIVRTQYGYHLILLVERRPPQPASLAQARSQIRNQLLSSKQEAAFAQWLKKIKATAKIARADRPIE